MEIYSIHFWLFNKFEIVLQLFATTDRSTWTAATWLQCTPPSSPLLGGLLSGFYHGATAPSGSRSLHYRGFMVTLRHSTLGRTPLDGWSARHRDLYLTTQSSQQTSMPPAGFEPTSPASERPQTHALDRAAIGIASFRFLGQNFVCMYYVTYSFICFQIFCSTSCFETSWNYALHLKRGIKYNNRTKHDVNL